MMASRSQCRLLILTFAISWLLASCVQANNLLVIMAQQNEPYTTLHDHVMMKLEQMGYAEGLNLNVNRWSIGNTQGMARRVQFQIQGEHYDAVLILGTMAAVYFKDYAAANPDLKFIFGGVTDPIGIGLLDGMEGRVHKNYTGIAYPVKVENRLRLIRALMPQVRRNTHFWLMRDLIRDCTWWPMKMALKRG